MTKLTKNIFITFEGCEGSGKTTQSKLLAEKFTRQSLKILLTREIGGTKLGENIRSLVLQEEMSIQTELLLVMAARCQHIEAIKESLYNDIHVICDRFVDSTAAYQGEAGGLGMEYIYKLHEDLLNNFLPDITFFCDITPEVAIERARMRGDITKFENKPLEFHKKVYQAFKKVLALFPDRLYKIDATRPQDQIHEEIIRVLNQKYNLKL